MHIPLSYLLIFAGLVFTIGILIGWLREWAPHKVGFGTGLVLTTVAIVWGQVTAYDPSEVLPENFLYALESVMILVGMPLYFGCALAQLIRRSKTQ